MIKKLIQIILLSAAAVAAGCASGEGKSLEFPSWSFNTAMLFPADHSLIRPEDGVALQDGRVVVADQVDGLRIISADGIEPAVRHQYGARRSFRRDLVYTIDSEQTRTGGKGSFSFR